MAVKRKKLVLVSVINRKKDLEILLSEKWYRIPLSKLPARPFRWLAFYQTSALGKDGKRIRYYARLKRRRRVFRRELLPGERDHPRYNEKYYKLTFSKIRELAQPIYNNTSMRVTFGYTTLTRLRRFRSLHTLFGIRPLEAIFRRMLRKEKIPFVPEYRVRSRGRVRYRLDLAVVCNRGKIDVECDMPKYHSGKRHLYDCRRDRFLRRRGWTVLRFSDEDVLFHPQECFEKLNEVINSLGGALKDVGADKKPNT